MIELWLIIVTGMAPHIPVKHQEILSPTCREIVADLRESPYTLTARCEVRKRTTKKEEA